MRSTKCTEFTIHLKKCCYTIKKAKEVKKENPTAPPERWLFVAVHDDMPDDVIFEELVAIKSWLSNHEFRLRFAYNQKELRLNRFVQSISDARRIYAEKQGVRVVRVASVSGNKKTLESLLGCQID